MITVILVATVLIILIRHADAGNRSSWRTKGMDRNWSNSDDDDDDGDDDNDDDE